MWQRRWTGILFGVAAAAAMLPILAQDSLPPQPYVDLPSGGSWQGMAYFGSATEQLAAPITFDVDGGGTPSGNIRFEFQFEGMAENLVELMNTHGCVASFEAIAPGSSPVSGYFMDAERAVGSFAVNACYLEGYGDLTFGAPISGVWYAEKEATTDVVFGVQPTQVPANEPTETSPTEVTATIEGDAVAGDGEQLAFGIEVFLNNCSECHGYFGEGGSGVANLTEPRVQRMTDEKLLEIINLGVEGTEMEPWGRILTEEEKAAVMIVIRNPNSLREHYAAQSGG